MSYYDQNQYYLLKSEADGGNPASMYELAILCDCASLDEEYVFWLKEFLESKEIQGILEDLDDDEGIFCLTNNPLEDYIYYDMIIEVGISLGLYYMNSSIINEVELSQTAFYAARLASKFAYVEVEDGGDMTDIVSLMAKVNKRIAILEERMKNNER